MIDEAAIRKLVLRYFECLDTEDWDGMRAIWQEDGRLQAVGARPRNDREGVVEYFSKIFVPWPSHVDHPVRLIVSEADQMAVAEVQFRGRTADGRDVTFDAVDVFDIGADGRIARLSNWYDIDYARRVVAPPAST